jgi:valyl-tRNA synthetase
LIGGGGLTFARGGVQYKGVEFSVMDKNFDFKTAEAQIYKKWLDTGAFTAHVNPKKKPYTVIMPPPNITARLHIGHAFGLTIQDSIIRFKRMQGFEALFLPGADHAAVATEVKIVEELKKQGINKSDLTREQFMLHVDKWYKTYTEQITAQMRALGLSCDWSRFGFTMNQSTTKAVNAAFKILHDKGLIYKGKRMVNVCPGCKSALSDAEVEYKMQERKMYHVVYEFADEPQKGITVATVRPETIFGDTAVAVNPSDKRYKKYIGRHVVNPLTGAKIPVIADDYVDVKFGTGALKITPAHDMADHEIGKRHNLETIIVEDLSKAARDRAIETLKQKGSLVKEVKYTGNVGVCYRCFSPVEPTISNQWFVAMEKLAKPAIAAIKNGLNIVPKKFEKTYLNWLLNIKDWCISRQITSGHKIPIEGETDVLDTWFSSALWPFCTLGYPDTNSPDYKYFYPTQTLVTAYDILFFWVIRMVFSGIEYTGKIPFENVIFTGLVRDLQGRKMSKSLGNGIDPVKVIDEFGTDVLRFSILAGTKLDRDPRFGMEKATLARNFINKIWNATKFYTMIKDEPNPKNLSLADKWILTKTNNIVKSVTKKYEKFDFGVAATELQNFFWSTFCDWYIEESKTQKNPAVFDHVLTTFLKLIAPIMPFVTETIWCDVLGNKTTMLTEAFPTENKKNNFPRETKEFEKHIEAVKTERNAKTEAENRAKQIETLKKEIERGETKLQNADFVNRAPKDLVQKERDKLAENRRALSELSRA